MSDQSRQNKSGGLPRRRRWRRWLALIGCLVLLCWFGHFAYLRITRRPTPRPDYWNAQLAKIDPLSEGTFNAREALAILKNRPWEATLGTSGAFSLNYSNLLEGPWDENRHDIATVSTIFASSQFNGAYAMVQEVLAVGWRDELDDPIRAWSIYNSYNKWVMLLVARSRWASEQLGDTDAMVEDWLAALRLAREAMRNGVWGRGAKAIHQVAAEMRYRAYESTNSIDTADLVRRYDEILSGTEGPRRRLETMRIRLHHYLEKVYVREGGDWMSVSDLTAVSIDIGWGFVTPSRMWNLTSPLFHDLATARDAADRYIAAGDRLTDLTACWRALRNLDKRYSAAKPTILDGITHYPFFDPGHMLFDYYFACCDLEGSATLLALKEYHRAHGSYPGTLDELVPDFLPRLPIDYADRKPLRYIREDQGYLLYSIGADGRDNGGARAPDGLTYRDPLKSPDVVFEAVERPGVPE